MPSPITIRAGPGALERIRSHGLDAADVSLIPGAAGGPKALGILGLDRAIFGEWLPGKPRTRHLVGASIGAWRFAAACCTDPEPVFAAFARGYSEQRYSLKPSAKEVSDSARALLRELFHGREDETPDAERGDGGLIRARMEACGLHRPDDAPERSSREQGRSALHRDRGIVGQVHLQQAIETRRVELA